VFGFGFGSVWVWVVSKNRSLVWFGSKFFVLGLVRFGLHFENLVRFGSQNSELVATLSLTTRPPMIKIICEILLSQQQKALTSRKRVISTLNLFEKGMQ
jgi:hypothetical protein